MKLSKLNELPAKREMIDVFGGYNHNLRISDGEFYDMKNLTSADYPILSPRPKRGIYASLEKPNGLISKDALCYVEGSKLYINKYEIDGFKLDEINDLELTDTTKTLISMGAYIIIMPDAKYINTKNYDDKGKINAEFVSTTDVYFSLCDKEGNEHENPILDELGNKVPVMTSPTCPYDIGNMPSGMYWIDTSCNLI